MKPNLTDVLCTRCGLCCDGSLFADVELGGRAEATRLEAMGLAIEDEDGNRPLLLQPCAALQGRRCGIYAHRPGCCRTFECRLLQDVRRGAVGVERALEQIAEALGKLGRVKELMAGRGDARLPLAERVAEALAAEVGASPDAKRRQAELEIAMADVEHVIRRTFLDGPEA
jgi:Fe-S-cluster containining protein